MMTFISPWLRKPVAIALAGALGAASYQARRDRSGNR
jgi:hypothetical protein